MVQVSITTSQKYEVYKFLTELPLYFFEHYLGQQSVVYIEYSYK
jgi:hypothetical protein